MVVNPEDPEQKAEAEGKKEEQGGGILPTVSRYPRHTASSARDVIARVWCVAPALHRGGWMHRAFRIVYVCVCVRAHTGVRPRCATPHEYARTRVHARVRERACIVKQSRVVGLQRPRDA